MKTIQINSQKKISVSNYVSAWKKLKSIPKDMREKITVKESLCTWYAVTAEVCYQQYITGLHDRINMATPNKNI